MITITLDHEAAEYIKKRSAYCHRNEIGAGQRRLTLLRQKRNRLLCTGGNDR